MKRIMQIMSLGVLYSIFALLWPSRAHAQAPVILTDEQDSYLLGLHVATLHDPSGELTLEQVMSPEYAAQFVPSQEEIPSIGFDTTGWVRLQVINHSHQTWRLVYGWANMQELDYYVFDSQQKLLEHVATGSARPFAQRQVPHHAFVFTPKFQPNEKYTLYLHLHGRYLVPVPMVMQTVGAWGEVNGAQNFQNGLYFGALLIMLGYNFVLFLFLRDGSYFYFVAFLGSFIIGQGFALGVGAYVVGDLIMNWNYHGVVIAYAAYFSFALLFSHAVLEIKTISLYLSKLIYGYVILLIIVTFIFIFNISAIPGLISLSLTPILVLTLTFAAWWLGQRTAHYFLIAWLVYGVAQTIYVLPRLGLLPITRFTEHGYQVGAVLMMLLLSLALANRINLLQLAIQQANYYLSASEYKFRSLFEYSKDAIIVTTLEGQVIEANIAALQLFGYPPEQNLAQVDLLTHYVHLANREHLQAALQQQGYLKDYELKFRRHDGTHFDAIITATLQQGQTPYIQTILRDITYRKQAEQERLKLTAIQQELKVAGDIQNNFLLPPRPNWPGLEIICFTSPAKEVGGDFYAYQRLAEGYSLAIGDISGKGIPAAMFMGVSLAALQAMSRQGLSPTELLGQLDQTLLTYTQKNRQNCAMCYVDLKPISVNNYRLQVANAGCVTPIIKRHDGSVEWVEVGGMPLGTGFSQTLPYQQLELTLTKGDMIILTTDGVVEANNYTNGMYGFPRLEAAVKAAPLTNAAALLEYLKQDLLTFVGQAEPHDDITIMVIQL